MKLNEQLGSWYLPLKPFIDNPEFDKIGAYLMGEANAGRVVTPTFNNIFRAFKECPYDQLKVVFLAGSPYQGNLMSHKHYADGLAFSAREHHETMLPLKILLESVEKDCYDGFDLNVTTMLDLTPWANQGVLLLNSLLTAQLGSDIKHTFWRPFIEYVIRHLDQHQRLIYVLMGKEAHRYIPMIDETRNYVIATSMPNTTDWEDYHVFSRVNRILNQTNHAKIDWSETVAV